mmetsp:Transcript_5697/g.8035  ORF Transcript_5697/g.8035 Transcript_5697/m.8035 type:complete len:605 (-) Transcript_5697:39-1853(-)
MTVTMNVYNPFKSITEDPKIRFHWSTAANKATVSSSSSVNAEDDASSTTKTPWLPFSFQDEELTPVRSNSKRELTPERRRHHGGVQLDGAATSDALEKDEEEDILPPAPSPSLGAAPVAGDCAVTPGSRSSTSRLSSASTAPLSDKSTEEMIPDVAVAKTRSKEEASEPARRKKRRSSVERPKSSRSKSHKESRKDERRRSSLKKSKSSKKKKDRKRHSTSNKSSGRSRKHSKEEKDDRGGWAQIQQSVSLNDVFQAEPKASNNYDLVSSTRSLRSVYHEDATRRKLLKSDARAVRRSHSWDPLPASEMQRVEERLMSASTGRRPSDLARRNLECQQEKAKCIQRRIMNKNREEDDDDDDSVGGAPSLDNFLARHENKSNGGSLRRTGSTGNNSKPRMAAVESDDDDDMFSLFSWSQSEASTRRHMLRRRGSLGSLGSLQESIRSMQSFGNLSGSGSRPSSRNHHSTSEVLTAAEQERMEAYARCKNRQMKRGAASMRKLANVLEKREQPKKVTHNKGKEEASTGTSRRRLRRSQSVEGVMETTKQSSKEQSKGHRGSTRRLKKQDGEMGRSQRNSVTPEPKGTASKLKQIRRRRRNSTSDLGR